MKYWLDTEFIEAPGVLDLISIGIVCEDGRELYLESSEVDWSRASDWVLENVRPHLNGVKTSRLGIRASILAFTQAGYGEPEFIGYYACYDWVAFCWLFGTMMDLPRGYPMFCRDVKQMAVDVGDPELPPQTGTEHHALADARWTKQAWEFVSRLPASSGALPVVEKAKDTP